ncbi:hypothetical protein AVEN_106542-1 [Araneus ventricosus]|uniref:Uncharacterized protein n=1 Tax=Araneus ventricosus TaxID=182803 RepID=A0A4Y2PB19_ARAVE|nr:hypothetical protein AVEN_106542-1 [Araneus ventricosus]
MLSQRNHYPARSLLQANFRLGHFISEHTLLGTVSYGIIQLFTSATSSDNRNQNGCACVQKHTDTGLWAPHDCALSVVKQISFYLYSGEASFGVTGGLKKRTIFRDR